MNRYFQPHLFHPPISFPKYYQQQTIVEDPPHILKYLLNLWFPFFLSLTPYPCYYPPNIFYLNLLQKPNAMGRHLLSPPNTELFFILHYTPLYFLFFLFCYIWIFGFILNVLGWKIIFLSTTELSSILRWPPILFLIFVFYYIWLFCVNLDDLLLHLFSLTTKRMIFHPPFKSYPFHYLLILFNLVILQQPLWSGM